MYFTIFVSKQFFASDFTVKSFGGKYMQVSLSKSIVSPVRCTHMHKLENGIPTL